MLYFYVFALGTFGFAVKFAFFSSTLDERVFVLFGMIAWAYLSNFFYTRSKLANLEKDQKAEENKDK